MAIELIESEEVIWLNDTLNKFQDILGNNYSGYKNHVFRVYLFCLALRSCNVEERKKLLISSCFHDLGIWTNNTVDYLPPSIALAKKYLKQNNLEYLNLEISLIIDMHHKLRKYSNNEYPLVETFRQADMIDVTLGAVKWGLSRVQIKTIRDQFPNAGFHKFLLKLTGECFYQNPLSLPPFIKW